MQTIQIGFTDDELWISKENEYRPYGNFAVDTVNNHLYAFTLRDADPSTRFFKFKLPEIQLLGVNALTALPFDVAEAQDNKMTNTSNGVIGNNTSYWTTGLISVGDAIGVKLSHQANAVLCYDADQNFIGNCGAVSIGIFDKVFLDGTAFIRINFHKNYTTFEQASEVVLTGVRLIESTFGYDPTGVIPDKAMSGKEFTDNTTYWLTGYISVGDFASCWFNFKPYKVGFFDADKVMLSTVYPDVTTTLPDGTAFVVAQYNINHVPFENADKVVVLEAEPAISTDSTIVLSTEDIVDYFDTDHYPGIQGGACHNERLYVTSGWGGTDPSGCYLHIVDPKAKMEVSTIDFRVILNGEPEAVEVVNDKLLYGTGGKVYELIV